MININIFNDRFNKNRVPDLRDSVETFSELVEVFEHYGKNNELGHLINFWSCDSAELTTDNIKETNVILLDFDVHQEYKDTAHFMNSIKYTYTFNEIKRLLDKNNLNYIMYKTKSYSSYKQCFRVVLPLTNSISPVTMKRFLKWLKIAKYELRTLDPVSFRNQIFLLPFNPKGEVDVISKVDGCDVDLFKDNGFFPKFREDIIILNDMIEEEEQNIEIGTEDEEEQNLRDQLEKMTWRNGHKHTTLVGLIYAYKAKGLKYNIIKSIVNMNTSFKINWKLYDNLR